VLRKMSESAKSHYKIPSKLGKRIDSENTHDSQRGTARFMLFDVTLSPGKYL